MQHGLERSSGRDGLNCWSSWYDSSGWVEEAKGFLRWGVTARRDGGMQPTAFGAQDRWFFEVSLCSAPRRQLKPRPLGGTILGASRCPFRTAARYDLLAGAC